MGFQLKEICPWRSFIHSYHPIPWRNSITRPITLQAECIHTTQQRHQGIGKILIQVSFQTGPKSAMDYFKKTFYVEFQKSWNLFFCRVHGVIRSKKACTFLGGQGVNFFYFFASKVDEKNFTVHFSVGNGLAAGWPDEFVKKSAQNVAQPIFVKISTVLLPLKKQS
jgi:hypothetical protein